MKVYCKSCNEYIYMTRATSKTMRCPKCSGKISGRKQREVWRELNNERQGRFDAVEDAMNTRRPLPKQRDIWDD